MDRSEKLKQLFGAVSEQHISKEILIQDLQDLLSASEYSYQREKLANAIGWAEIYFSPRRWASWGDRNTVKHFLLSDIHRAEMGEDTYRLLSGRLNATD